MPSNEKPVARGGDVPGTQTELKRLLARGPLCTQMVNWVVIQLDMDASDKRHALNLWQVHWRARGVGPIRDFLSGGGRGDDPFVASVKAWTGGTDNPRRILMLNATRWTPLERQFVVHWAYVQFVRLQAGIAWNRRIPADGIEDVIQEFWTQILRSADAGPLRGYIYEPTSPLSPEDQFRVYLTKCFVNHCLGRAAELAEERNRAEELEEEQFLTAPTASRAGFGTRGDPRPFHSQLQELMEACEPKLTLMEKEVLKRHLLWGESRKEIAARLGTTANAVGVRLHRGRKKLLAFVGQAFVTELSVGQETGKRP